MWWIRKWVYRLGFRPKPGSIFYSPSKDWILSMEDAGPQLIAAFEKGYKEAEAWRNSISTEKNSTEETSVSPSWIDSATMEYIRGVSSRNITPSITPETVSSGQTNNRER